MAFHQQNPHYKQWTLTSKLAERMATVYIQQACWEQWMWLLTMQRLSWLRFHTNYPGRWIAKWLLGVLVSLGCECKLCNKRNPTYLAKVQLDLLLSTSQHWELLCYIFSHISIPSRVVVDNIIALEWVKNSNKLSGCFPELFFQWFCFPKYTLWNKKSQLLY